MKTIDFDYDLPQELIAQKPIEPRDASRLLVVDREGDFVRHEVFTDILDNLRAGDCIVINETKVIPARIIGKKGSGGVAEILLLNRLGLNRWEAMARPGRRLKAGAKIYFGGDEESHQMVATVIAELAGGKREIELEYEGVFEDVLDKLGQMPLPPYIDEVLEDNTRYNTVYARYDGSSAAPTAGLHFTQNLLNRVEECGIKIARITLCVGLGTFRPVKDEDLEDHLMHSEHFTISPEAASIINETREAGGRVIAVGTTAVRSLESAAKVVTSVNAESSHGKYVCVPAEEETNIFIYPGYNFKLVDGIITNFHLPKSTLIMLISAFAGRDNILKAYEIAINHKYRFFSFGDAMLII